MNKKSIKKDSFLHIRIDDSTKSMLENMALHDGRSMSNFICQLIYNEYVKRFS